MRIIGKIGLKLFFLLVPFQLCIYILACFPMHFYDEEYAWYRQNLDYANGHTDYCRVLIAGDSTAKAGYLPSELSDDTYNFALGGASVMEEYYFLRDYLEKNDKPKYIVFTNAARKFIDADSFWNRSVYFHRLNWKDICDLSEEVEQFQDLSIFKIGGGI